MSTLAPVRTRGKVGRERRHRMTGELQFPGPQKLSLPMLIGLGVGGVVGLAVDLVWIRGLGIAWRPRKHTGSAP